MHSFVLFDYYRFDNSKFDRKFTLGFRSGIFRKRETLLRGERDDGTKGIYLLAAFRGAPNPRRFLSLFPFLLKCQRGKERKKEEERRREKERKRPVHAKYENPYSREEKISVI